MDYQLRQQQLAASRSSSGGGSSSVKKGSSGSSSGSSSVNKGSSSSTKTGTANTQKQSSSYNDVLKTTRTLYNASRTNKRGAAESLLATYVANGSITQAEAQKILSNLGIK